MTSYAPIFSKDQAQWRNKTKELINLVIVKNARVELHECARKLMSVGSFKDRFSDTSEMKLYCLLI